MSPSESWWGLLLSGMIGSVIGGVATFLAVWLAIRHDRQMRREDRLADAVATAYAAAGRYGSAMQAAGGVADEAAVELFESLLRDISMAIAGARSLAPGPTRFLNEATAALAEDPSDADAYRMLNAGLHHWFSEPGRFEDRRFTYDTLRQKMSASRVQRADRP